MPTIKSTRFGEIRIDEKEIIDFDKGLPGFEQETQFFIIQEEKDYSFAYLQSLKTPELAFIIMNPFEIFQDYEFDLDEQNKEELKIEDVSEVAVFVILSIPEDFAKTTINLKAPLIMNIKKKKGKQIILHDSGYLTKTPLFSEPIKKGGE